MTLSGKNKMEDLNFKPKTKKCPKCGATLSLSAESCPLCNGYEQDKNVSAKLDTMRKGKLGIKAKHFGRVKI